MYCTSAAENPIMLMVLKPEVLQARRMTLEDEHHLLQDIVDEVSLRCRKWEIDMLTMC